MNSKSRRPSAMFWALHTTWAASREELVGLVGCTLLLGMVPAGFALAVRGLINATTDALQESSQDFFSVSTWLLAVFAVTLIGALAALLVQFVLQRLRGNLTLDLNTKVLNQAARLDLPYFESGSHREIIEHIQRDPGLKLHQFIVESHKAFLAALQMSSLLLVLVWMEPLILVAVVLLALPFFLFEWRLARTRFQTEHRRTRKRRWTRWFLRKLTSLEVVGEIKLLGIGGLLTDRFAAAMRDIRDQDRRLEIRQLAGGSLFAALTTLVLTGLFARVTYNVFQGQLTIGDLAICGGAVVRVRGALDSTIRSAAMAYEHSLFLGQLRDFLRASPMVLDEARGGAPPAEGSLRVSGLWFAYPGNDQPVLRDVSLVVEAGEIVAIVGENGSGKSTLAKLLARLYDPDRGEILLDGRALRDYPLSDLHGRISLLGQSFGRYEASLAENIAYGDWERLRDDRAEIESLAELTGVVRIAEHLPQGLDTVLGREFSEHDLSGGQWQRVALARALARGASLLILDEPTSNIDARAENDLFRAVESAVRGHTAIVISHRFSTLQMADRILVMHQGRIVEDGTHDALMAAGEHYATMYRLHERYRIRSSA